MNRIIIPSQKLKYVKLCIVSPLYEIITNVVYIISFLLVAFKLLLMGDGRMSNYQIGELVGEIYEKETFLKIKTENDLFNYLDKLVNNLYKYDPSQMVNIMIPFGSIRLKKYANDPIYCDINFALNCPDYSCTVRELDKIYSGKSLCGYPYKKAYSIPKSDSTSSLYTSLVRNFEGKYSQYNLVNDGVNFDFTIDDYTADVTSIKNFIKDKDLKSIQQLTSNSIVIAILFNVYFPLSKNYIYVIAGVEMVNYFTFANPIFTPTVYLHFDSKEPYFITVYAFFCMSVSLNIVKLIYEVNVKFVLSIHLLTLFHESINIIMIIFTSFYLTSSKDDLFLVNFVNSVGFKDNLPTIMINSYNQIIISILFLCIPFRLLSLISWYKEGSNQLVRYFSVIFRILPGILVLGIIMTMIILVFTSVNFFMYNSSLLMCENIFLALNMVFNFQIIKDIRMTKILDHSIYYSKYFLLYNALQLIILGIAFGIGIATIVHLFRKAANIGNNKEDNDVVIKLEEIKVKLTNEIMQYDNNLNGMKKQILWLNLGTKNDVANSFSDKQRIVQFKQADQIIAFLKYLFALKPDMQFKNLDDKFDIVIECRVLNGKIKDFELEQIDVLLDWLSFVGCKIPVALFSIERLERNLRMKIATCYIMVRFLTQKEDLAGFLKEYTNQNEDEEEKLSKINDLNRIVVKGKRFMIYPSTIKQKNEKNEIPDRTNSNREIKPQRLNFSALPSGRQHINNSRTEKSLLINPIISEEKHDENDGFKTDSF